jgi:ribosomal protein S8
MSMSDPVADLLTRIRNGQRAKKDSVVAPGSRNQQLDRSSTLAKSSFTSSTSPSQVFDLGRLIHA